MPLVTEALLRRLERREPLIDGQCGFQRRPQYLRRRLRVRRSSQHAIHYPVARALVVGIRPGKCRIGTLHLRRYNPGLEGALQAVDLGRDGRNTIGEIARPFGRVGEHHVAQVDALALKLTVQLRKRGQRDHDSLIHLILTLDGRLDLQDTESGRHNDGDNDDTERTEQQGTDAQTREAHHKTI